MAKSNQQYQKHTKIEAFEKEAHDPFLVEEVTEPINCLSCDMYKIGSRVCGILKPYNDYLTEKKKPTVEKEFYCVLHPELRKKK